jgi:hypothetical protein
VTPAHSSLQRAVWTFRAARFALSVGNSRKERSFKILTYANETPPSPPRESKSLLRSMFFRIFS